jgi:energy-converting hydrogenase Eha subunit E
MLQALIGLISAMVFLLVSSFIVGYLSMALAKRKDPYEKRLGIESLGMIGCSLIILSFRLDLSLLVIFAYSAIGLNLVKLMIIPYLLKLKRDDRKRYLVIKRWIRRHI